MDETTTGAEGAGSRHCADARRPTPLPPPTPAERIAIDDFMKVELRAAKILAAEAVPKSKKLIRLSVDVGEAEPRTIVAGIAEGYQPADLPGTHDRHRRQPEAGQADGHRVERHGAGRQP